MTMPLPGMLVAALLAGGGAVGTPIGASGGGAGLMSLGSTALVSVVPWLVLPVAKPGPSPPSVVDSRLRPTTRLGGSVTLGGSIALGGGGGGAIATFFGGATGGGSSTLGGGGGGSGFGG